MTAEARRQAEVIRGEGDAERNRIFAEAFQQDPEFFAFYRSMQAYAKALANKDTTLVLNPEFGLLQVFRHARQGSRTGTCCQAVTVVC